MPVKPLLKFVKGWGWGRQILSSPAAGFITFLERRQQAVSEESFGGVADTYVQSQYYEEAFEPYIRDVLGSTGADKGTHEDTEQFNTDERPEYRGIFNNHVGEDGGGHTYEYSKCGSTCNQIHGQTGNTGQEGDEEETATYGEEGSK